jgi:pimeloyl-ACP methyl ester carboxylesterase
MGDITRFQRTSLLEVGYEDQGQPAAGVVLLLHGWPDDVRTWDGVSPRLVQAGYRTLAPYLRGFGPTRFLDPATPRSGQITALAHDAVDLLDALAVPKVVLVGHDWGARVAYVLAALWPQRVERLLALSVGYGTSRKPNQGLSYPQSRDYWYQWLFHTERGRHAVEQDRRPLCRYLWQTWMPPAHFEEAAFDRTARSWDNPDWPAITLHSYRHRWGAAPGDGRYDASERAMAGVPALTVPAALLHGGEDGCTRPEMTEGLEAHFAGGYTRQVIPGVGHFPQREDPQAVAEAVLGVP